MRQITLGILLVGALLVSACANVTVNAPPTQQSPSTSQGMPSGMMHNMQPITSEYEFIREMIPHHQEAVDTAKLTLQTTQNPQLKELLENVVRAQEAEITMMEGWLATWYPQQSTKSSYQPMMGDLSALSGTARDTAFLQGMIMHHEMAVSMASDVLQLEPRSEVKALALNIVATQNEEIGRMKSMLGTNATCGSNCPMMHGMMH